MRNSIRQSRSISSEIIGLNSQRVSTIRKNGYSDDCDQMSKIISMEISDMVIVEFGKEIHILNQDDWKKIIKQQNMEGYNITDIHISLLSQNLNFTQRRQLWLLMGNVRTLKKEQEQQKKGYKYYLTKPCKYLGQIQKDTKRTCDDKFFKINENIQSLENILVAYANYDAELGYTQGMNFVVANILSCYDINNNDQEGMQDTEVLDYEREENVFYLFIHIMIQHNWRSVFMDGLPGLLRMLSTLEERLIKEIPDLHQHFFLQGATLELCFTQYYMTLMMYGGHIEFSRVVLDLFMLEGESIIHNFLIAMLKYSQNILMKKQFDGIYHFCKEQLLPEFYNIYKQKERLKDLQSTFINLGLIKLTNIKQYQQQQLQNIQEQIEEHNNEEIQIQQNNSPKRGRWLTDRVKYFFSRSKLNQKVQ